MAKVVWQCLYSLLACTFNFTLFAEAVLDVVFGKFYSEFSHKALHGFALAGKAASFFWRAGELKKDTAEHGVAAAAQRRPQNAQRVR